MAENRPALELLIDMAFWLVVLGVIVLIESC